MANRLKQGAEPSLGQDAFLDVAANLVAIVIILVVVVGSHTKKMVDEAKQEQVTAAPAASVVHQEEQLKQKFDTLETEAQRAQAAFDESEKLEATIKQSDELLATMDRERGKMIDVLVILKEAWKENQKELDQTVVLRARAMTAQTTAETEYQQLAATRARLENTPEPVVAIAHLPTPMAKTVFGEELHFRLKAGRLSVVPIERLIQEIKNDFQHSAAGNREGLMESAAGPVNGFIVKYQMSKSREMVSQGGASSMATRIELVNMTIEPLEEPHGQPIDSVIAGNGSQLDIELAGRRPERTTVTVWVYPDSFADFRRLKEHLYARGYATAARPLPMGMPISGGPQGSRSQAQ